MQKRNLSSRHKLILNYMNGKHSVGPGRELAERLGVSTRTVRFAVNDPAGGQKTGMNKVGTGSASTIRTS